MKRKFFWTFFFIFTLFILAIFTLDRFYLIHQNEESIRSELESMASTIIASNVSIDILNKFEATDDIIRDILENERVDRTIRIFDHNKTLVFFNDLAKTMEGGSSSDTWSEIEVSGHKLKRLTIQTEALTLEIGIFLDSKLDQMKTHLNQIAILLLVMFVLALLISQLMSKLIMSPLNELGQFFINYNLKRSNSSSEEHNPGDIETLKLLSRSRDEVSILAKSLLSFLDQIKNEENKKNRDIFFLAHELKTPLSHLVIGLESLKQEAANPLENSQLDRLLTICKNLSIFIKDYLRIAAIRSSPLELLQISAVHISRVVSSLTEQLGSNEKSRLIVNLQSDLIILAELHHVESLISNLISNALKYSTGQVFVDITANKLIISNTGAGFSEKALKQIGEPFNRSGLEESSGLGLTYCFEICKVYGWTIQHQKENTNNTTKMIVEFNKDSISS